MTCQNDQRHTTGLHHRWQSGRKAINNVGAAPGPLERRLRRAAKLRQRRHHQVERAAGHRLEQIA